MEIRSRTIVLSFLVVSVFFTSFVAAGQPQFTATQIHQATGPVYGLAWGEFDSLHDGMEIACLASDGSVLELSRSGTSWDATVRYGGESPISGMWDRPTIAIGNVHSGYPSNEVVIRPGRAPSLVTMVFYNPASGWSHETLFDNTGMSGSSWGARVGDFDPNRSGDEIFHIHEGVSDLSTGTVFSEASGSWAEEVIYGGEVGMDSAAGDFNPDNSGPEIVVVTEMGPTYEILPPDGPSTGMWPRRTIWDDDYNAGWVVKIADVDPCQPGNELVYGTRYSNRIMMSRHNGLGPHELQVLFTGDATGDSRNMWDIAVGDILPDSYGLEILGVDKTGSIYLVWCVEDSWQGQVIWQGTNGELYAVITGDFLPARYGNEIIVAGQSGAITMLTCTSTGKNDITGDATVDLQDFALLAFDWLECSPNLPGDITWDDCVDTNDLWGLTDCWLDCYVTAASGSSPGDNQIAVDPNGTLSWSAGGGALLHNVYFGADFNDVNIAAPDSNEYMGQQASTTWDPNNYDSNGLDFNTTYCWRIDEVGARCTNKGNVWSFTTWVPFDPNLDLVSWWKLDEPNGTMAYDSAGSNHGTLNGDPNWTTGQIGGALDFDGTGDYVNCGSDTSLDISGSVSIAAWVRFDTLAASYQTILSKRGTLGDTTCNYALRTKAGSDFPVVEDDELEFYYHDGTNWHVYRTSNAYLFSGIWYHVVSTFTFGTGTSIKLYINGTLKSGSWQKGGGNSAVQTNTKPVTLGGLTNGEFINAKLDDVRIYDRALSDGEVLLLYQSGL